MLAECPFDMLQYILERPGDRPTAGAIGWCVGYILVRQAAAAFFRAIVSHDYTTTIALPRSTCIQGID